MDQDEKLPELTPQEAKEWEGLTIDQALQKATANLNEEEKDKFGFEVFKHYLGGWTKDLEIIKSQICLFNYIMKLEGKGARKISAMDKDFPSHPEIAKNIKRGREIYLSLIGTMRLVEETIKKTEFSPTEEKIWAEYGYCKRKTELRKP